MATRPAMPPLLELLPREVRDEIFGYLALPEYIYTSSSTANTHNLHQGRLPEKTYIDTRLYLPSHPPANVLATCRQLREECLEHHNHVLNSATPVMSQGPAKKLISSILAERLGDELSEEAERACDDGTLRITIEVQRSQRGPMGYFVPIRDEFSPRFMALLPLMNRTRKLRLVVWPGYNWWDGSLPQPLRRIDKPEVSNMSISDSTTPNAASIAITRLLEHLPDVEELSVEVLMHASDAGRWDLPDNKWEKVQPWLDSPLTVDGGRALKKVTRRLTGLYKPSEPEPFYIQVETRQKLGRTWKVERKGDMRTASTPWPTI